MVRAVAAPTAAAQAVLAAVTAQMAARAMQQAARVKELPQESSENQKEHFIRAAAVAAVHLITPHLLAVLVAADVVATHCQMQLTVPNLALITQAAAVAVAMMVEQGAVLASSSSAMSVTDRREAQ